MQGQRRCYARGVMPESVGPPCRPGAVGARAEGERETLRRRACPGRARRGRRDITAAIAALVRAFHSALNVATALARRTGPALLPAVAAFTVLTPTAASAKVFVTVDEAVREAFPEARIEKRTDYLTEEQAKRIAALAGSPPSTRIVISYRGMKDGRALGTAYLETHLVRTLPETILVVVEPEGRVRKVEILSFDEPQEFLPKDRWLDQFKGRGLDAELSLRGAIRGVTGATLSSRAIAAAVRRVLATQTVLFPAPPPPTPPAATTSPPPPAESPASPALPPHPKPPTPPASPPAPAPAEENPPRPSDAVPPHPPPLVERPTLLRSVTQWLDESPPRSPAALSLVRG